MKKSEETTEKKFLCGFFVGIFAQITLLKRGIVLHSIIIKKYVN